MGVLFTHSVVEATMVRLWGSDNKLARSLITRIHGHACLFEAFRGHQRDKLEEQIRLRVKEVWSLTPQSLFEFVRRRPRDAIPRLGLPPVH